MATKIIVTSSLFSKTPRLSPEALLLLDKIHACVHLERLSFIHKVIRNVVQTPGRVTNVSNYQLLALFDSTWMHFLRKHPSHRRALFWHYFNAYCRRRDSDRDGDDISSGGGVNGSAAVGNTTVSNTAVSSSSGSSSRSNSDIIGPSASEQLFIELMADVPTYLRNDMATVMDAVLMRYGILNFEVLEIHDRSPSPSLFPGDMFDGFGMRPSSDEEDSAGEEEACEEDELDGGRGAGGDK